MLSVREKKLYKRIEEYRFIKVAESMLERGKMLLKQVDTLLAIAYTVMEAREWHHSKVTLRIDTMCAVY